MRRAAAAAVLVAATLLAAGCQAGASATETDPGASARLSSAEATLDRLEHDVDTDGGG